MATVALYEQVYEEAESGELVPLEDEVFIRLQPPMSFALNITPVGRSSYDLLRVSRPALVSSQPQANGFEAERIHPICDDWQESFDLKQGAESLIIEHVFREKISRIVYKKTYQFTP